VFYCNGFLLLFAMLCLDLDDHAAGANARGIPCFAVVLYESSSAGFFALDRRYSDVFV
jgi:hypothetical protein